MRDSRDASLRLRVAGIAILGLFLALALAAYVSGRKVERGSLMITKDAVPGTIAAHDMRGAISRSIGYAMVAAMSETTEQREASFKVVKEADETFQRAISQYEATIRLDPNEDRKLVEQVRSRYEEFLRQRAAYEALIRAGDRTGSAAFLVRDLVPAYNRVIESAEVLLKYNHANSVALAGTIAASIRGLHWTVLVVMVLAVICTVVLGVNFSIRRREMMELRNNERRLREVLDNLHISVAVLDLDFRVVEINRGPLDRAGLRREDVLGGAVA